MAGRLTGKARTIVFPTDLLDDLAPHAAKRGVSVNKLARILVEEIVDARLVDKVLAPIESGFVKGASA